MGLITKLIKKDTVRILTSWIKKHRQEIVYCIHQGYDQDIAEEIIKELSK